MTLTHHPIIVQVGESGLGPYGQIVVADRHVFSADEPERRGGRDTGPAPYQLLAAGLGACTAITIRMYAERKGWPLARVSVQVTHEKHDGQSGGLDRFARLITLEGPLDEAQRQRLREIADKCPVHRTLSRDNEIETALAPPEGAAEAAPAPEPQAREAAEPVA